MQISIINKIEDFLLIKEDWNILFSRSNCTVFQSFDFNYYSWKHELISDNRNQLAIAVITINEIVVAIFPFYIDSNKQLRFINDVHADFCDCITQKQIDIEKVLDTLKEQFPIKNIQLINLKVDSIIKTFFEITKDKYLVLKPFEKYAELLLEKGNFPENYSAFRSKQKTEFRRIKKKNEGKLHKIFSADKLDFPKKDILSLKEKMIDLGFRDKSYLPTSQLKLIESLYISSKLIISAVKSEKKTNAISFILQKSDEYLFWIDMFDNTTMINIYNYISLMNSLSSENSVKMNLGRGAYDYKITNFKPDVQQLFAVFIFSSLFQKFTFLFFENIKRIIKPIYQKIKG